MEEELLRSLPAGNLLSIHSRIIEELRRRELVRSSNNPVADLAEHLACKALDLKLAGGSNAGHDAIDSNGARYQVKARRITSQNTSRQLSYIRNLDAGPFEFLFGVLFDSDFRVMRACLVPIAVVRARATYQSSVNGHRFFLRDDVWNEPMVRDLTAEVIKAAGTL